MRGRGDLLIPLRGRIPTRWQLLQTTVRNCVSSWTSSKVRGRVRRRFLDDQPVERSPGVPLFVRHEPVRFWPQVDQRLVLVQIRCHTPPDGLSEPIGHGYRHCPFLHPGPATAGPLAAELVCNPGI